MMKKILGILFLLIIFASGFQAYKTYSEISNVSSFEECVKAKGSTMMTSYPGACVTRLGKSFTEDISIDDGVLSPPASSCGSCPELSPPAPGFCQDGNIVAGQVNECGCQLGPECSYNKKPSPNPYTCPKSEWVDCMPGPDSAGIKWVCTDEFLSWATANCPGFKGAAY